MIFKQFRYEPLNQASYLVGCPRAKEGVVVDPIDALGVDHYVLEAADLTLRIAGVIETHVHADYVSCARELAEANGCPHHLHASAPVTYDFEPVDDGQVLEVRQVRLEAIHTPGHTPEHTSWLIRDLARSEEPWAVLTGDCLFVGDVGRPDLLVGTRPWTSWTPGSGPAPSTGASGSASSRFPSTWRCSRTTTGARRAAGST